MLGLLVFGVVFEILLRVSPASDAYAKVLFFNQFKLSRWEFLSARHHQLNVEWVLNVIAQKNADYQEPPEPDRPAFDRVPRPYHIKTNQDGFRDKNFPAHSPPSIVLLGDSVGFGKGVRAQERFFSLLKHQFPHLPFYNLSLQGCTADCMATVFLQYVDRLNPKVVLVQSSSNDIDQTLWREGVSMEVPDKSIPLLFQWHTKSYLSQWLQLALGTSATETLSQHSLIVESYYQDSIQSIFDVASKHDVSLISVNLPFAYGWNYGDHLTRFCSRNNNCIDVSVNLDVHNNETTKQFNTIPDDERFDIRTAEELKLSLEMIQQVFPQPQYFLDVVHPTARGHWEIAKQIAPTLRNTLQQNH